MPAVIVEPHKSSIGNIDANTMAMLAFLATGILMLIPGVKYVAWLAPLALFVIEKQSSFVRFHAMQAFILNIISFLLTTVLGGIIITIVNAAFSRGTGNISAALAASAIVTVIIWIISAIFSILAVIALINAFKYRLYRIPLIGALAASFSGQ